MSWNQGALFASSLNRTYKKAILFTIIPIRPKDGLPPVYTKRAVEDVLDVTLGRS